MLNKLTILGVFTLLVFAQPIAHGQAAAVDKLALQMANSVAPDRFFVRANVVGIKIKSKSGDTYDVTGPVLAKSDLEKLQIDQGRYIEESIYARDPVGAAAPASSRDPTPNARSIALLLNGGASGNGPVNIQQVINAFDNNGVKALGTPAGIKATPDSEAFTVGLSLGYYLTDDYTWAVEGFFLGKPLETGIQGSGVAKYREDTTNGIYLRPFGLEGQTIVTTKMLPLNMMLGRYWGKKNARLRLYTGAIATYAIFYDSKATEALNQFNGGGSPGDTTISFKNAFAVGPMLGLKLQLNEAWHVNLNVGHIKLKAEGTVVTRNTTITKDTGAIQEFGSLVNLEDDGDPATPPPPAPISDTLATAEALLDPDTGTVGTTNNRALIAKLGGASGVSTGAIAYINGQANLGTYVRRAENTLDTTLFMLSVGRSF